jgi:transposase
MAQKRVAANGGIGSRRDVRNEDETQSLQPKIGYQAAKKPAEAVVKDIRRATRRHFSAEDKIRIVLEGLRGEESIAELCRREGIAQSVYYSWSKEFLEAGKRRLAGIRPALPPVTRSRTCAGKRWPSRNVADLTLENRLLKKA